MHAEPPTPYVQTQAQPVVITDVQIPFFKLVALITKCFLAAIPALLMLWVISAVLGLLMASFIGGIFKSLEHAGGNVQHHQVG